MREGSWSQRQLKSTTKGKKRKYVHTFCAAFEDLKVVWHANGTLQFQGKFAENATPEVNQLLDGKISADIKENDIPAKVDNLMEEMKRIWLTLSTVKLDLANVRRHAATPTYTHENVHQANSSNKSFSPDSNHQWITDFFINVSKEESLRAFRRQSDRRRLELLEERLRQMEVTKKRLLEENKQLRAENQHLHDHGPNETN